VRNKLLGADFVKPLAEASGDDHTAHKDAILADLAEDELDAMGEWEMKSRLKDYIVADYERFEDETLDEMWLMLADQLGLELKWSAKDTEENVRKMVKSAEEYNKNE